VTIPKNEPSADHGEAALAVLARLAKRVTPIQLGNALR
jgi:hypothetical protein